MCIKCEDIFAFIWLLKKEKLFSYAKLKFFRLRIKINLTFIFLILCYFILFMLTTQVLFNKPKNYLTTINSTKMCSIFSKSFALCWSEGVKFQSYRHLQQKGLAENWIFWSVGFRHNQIILGWGLSKSRGMLPSTFSCVCVNADQRVL